MHEDRASAVPACLAQLGHLRDEGAGCGSEPHPEVVEWVLLPHH